MHITCLLNAIILISLHMDGIRYCVHIKLYIKCKYILIHINAISIYWLTAAIEALKLSEYSSAKHELLLLQFYYYMYLLLSLLLLLLLNDC